MSSRITYENKQAIQNDENVARKNKVTDSDLNEIKEVVNAHADDIENFENYDDTEITQKYNELQQENTELKKTQDDMIEKSLNKETEADTSLIVKDTDEFYGKLSVYGGQRQEKREGYNKFNAYDVAFVNGINTNQEIIKSENNIVIPFLATWSRRKCTINNLKHNTTYKIFCTKNGDEGIESGLWDGSNYTSTGFSTNSSAKLYIDVPTDENGTLTFFFYCNYSATNYGNKTVEFDEIMLYEGTEDKPYEPFGVMPSLAYPSEIEAVENSVEITTSNKNLYDTTKFVQDTWNANGNTRVVAWLGKIEKGQKIVTKRNNAYEYLLGITTMNYRDIDNVLLYNDGWRTTEKSEMTATVNGYLFLQIRKNDNSNITSVELLTDDFQVEFDEETDYVEHHGKTHIMPIQKPMYDRDTFEKIDGIWYEKHNKVKMVFDGTENWNFNYNSAIFMLDANNILTLSSAETSKLSNFIQSNTYSNKVYDAMYNKQTDGIEALNNRINIRESSCSTVEEFKAMLAQRYAENKAIYAVCRLKEPLLIKCTEEQSKILDKIDTYKNGTIITTDNDLCKIKLRYKQSLEAAIKEYTATTVAESEE